MSKKILSREIREVLSMLKNTSYIITGSYSLKLQKVLNRMPGDLDLISDDLRVIDKLKENCLNYSSIIENRNHFRFLYDDTLFVDVFFVEDLSKIACDKLCRRGKIIKVSPPWYVFLKKLMVDREDDREQLRGDLISYFSKEQV